MWKLYNTSIHFGIIIQYKHNENSKANNAAKNFMLLAVLKAHPFKYFKFLHYQRKVWEVLF